jgi:hypothetical protein
MGDYLLMKPIILFLITLFISSSTCANELAWVDEQVEAIKPPRKAPKINNISNPFIFLEKNGYKKVAKAKSSKTRVKRKAGSSVNSSIGRLYLDAIINSSALINGKWYKKNDKIGSYTIASIDKNFITLKKGGKKMTLSTDSKKQNLKFKNK